MLLLLSLYKVTITQIKNIDKSLVLLKNYTKDFFNVNFLDLSRNKISTIFKHSIKGLFKRLNLKYNSINVFEKVELAGGQTDTLVSL